MFFFEGVVVFVVVLVECKYVVDEVGFFFW